LHEAFFFDGIAIPANSCLHEILHNGADGGNSDKEHALVVRIRPDGETYVTRGGRRENELPLDKEIASHVTVMELPEDEFYFCGTAFTILRLIGW
jgi:hypothetical protein